MPHPAKPAKEKFACRLLVEGSADYNFFGHLFVKRKLYEKQGKTIIPKGFETCPAGDWVGVLNGLAQITDKDVEILGIIVDADTDLRQRWKDIKDKLQEFELDYTLPVDPAPQGWTSDPQEGKKRLGIWIMPNNKTKGILEDFIIRMRHDNEDNQRLWGHVEHSINTLPDGPRFDESKDLAKAQVATWLAWQEEPGHPMGLAVSMGYVDAHSETVDDFINWLKRLFQLQPS